MGRDLGCHRVGHWETVVSSLLAGVCVPNLCDLSLHPFSPYANPESEKFNHARTHARMQRSGTRWTFQRLWDLDMGVQFKFILSYVVSSGPGLHTHTHREGTSTLEARGRRINEFEACQAYTDPIKHPPAPQDTHKGEGDEMTKRSIKPTT